MKFFCIPASLFACRSGLIEQLDFSQLRLEHVPREIIKSRKHIEELLLNVNSIEELPPELFRCTKIRRLDVSENKIKVVPVDIGALLSLAELNLSKNEIVEIPDEIGLCQSLASLDISTNIVTGFPKSFVNLGQLASLNLSNNSLTQLPQDIDRLQNLQFLDIAQCELRSLPPSIVRLERLRVLDLCDNYLTELPADMDHLLGLEMLDLHCNLITRLPDELLRCISLRTLDASGNQLAELPATVGGLHNLAELVLCENQIRVLPSAIGQLKKLEVLKVSKNCLSELTPSICSCYQLVDLILCENRLTELPASLGNLKRLRFLDLNVNDLHSIPTTIGGCQSLGVLSLRHNQLSELPMEIGKLNRLQVLDLADNNLKYLPYTLTVLYDAKTLSALWLSFNQPPLPKLSSTHEPVMNIKVLTCYLLPQKSVSSFSGANVSRGKSSSCIGGARVCFAGDRAEEEEDRVPIGRFERYDTPHPKPFAPKNRGANRNSGDFSGAAPSPPTKGSGQSKEAGGGSPSCSAPANDQSQSRPLRSVLKRRPQSVISHISASDLFPALLGGGGNENEESQRQPQRRTVRKMNIPLRRSEAGIQWTLVGGANSPPYKGKSGLFVSQLVPNGVADCAGFRVDDQLLAVNGQDMRGLGHQEAIQMIHKGGEQLEFLVEREQEKERADEKLRPSIPNICAVEGSSSSSPSASEQPKRLSALVARNGSGSVGFSVSGSGKWPEDPFTVAAVISTTECPLQPGDRIVMVGGTNVKFGARLDQVKTLLSGMPGTRIEVVVERGGQWPPPAPPPLPLPRNSDGQAFGELSLSRSLPSLLAPLASQQQQRGGDGKEENGGGGGGGTAKELPSAAKTISGALSQQPAPSNSNDGGRLFQRQSSVRGSQGKAGLGKGAQGSPACAPPLPPPRHHRSLSSLQQPDQKQQQDAGLITAQMLRSSTPIEYPPGEEPPSVCAPPASVPVEKRQIASLPSKCHQQSPPALLTAPATSFSSQPPPMPTLKTSASARAQMDLNGIVGDQQQSPVQSPMLLKKMPKEPMGVGMAGRMPLLMDPPLAASSPIPGGKLAQQQQKAEEEKARMTTSTATAPLPAGANVKCSQIPIPLAPAASSVGTTMGTGTMSNGASRIPLPPPPVAPKPKQQILPSTSCSSLGANGPSSLPLSGICPAVADDNNNVNIDNNSHISRSPTSFSSKLKHFEKLQQPTGTSPATHNQPPPSPNGINNNGNGTAKLSHHQFQLGPTKPSGIPLKKPLVSALDLEKLREAEERRQQRMGGGECEGEEEEDEEEEDEHRDTVRELSRLIGGGEQQQNGGGGISLFNNNNLASGPSVVRTKKAELRAASGSSTSPPSAPQSATMAPTAGDLDETAGSSLSLSRASSSLSQRAAEIEKRREWRQARLQSMDQESRRTDDLVKLIAAAAAATSGGGNANTGSESTAAGNSSSTPSPIPIVP